MTSDHSPIPLVPAVLLVAGFALVILLLTELINSGQRRGWTLTPTLRVLRNFVAPALAAMLFTTDVWRLAPDDVLGRMVKTVFWICALYAALSVVNDGIFGAAQRGSWQERVPKLLRDLARGIVIAVGAAIIYSQVWRQEISGALTALGVGGIVIGLALQEPLGNVVSGLMLLLERPLNIGDWIIADGTTGKVIEINWRSVHIETMLHEMRIIPNVSLYKESFSNLSRPTNDRTETYDIGFSYDHPPNVVKQALLALLESTPGVVAEPPPFVHTLTYGDFSITYRVYFTVARYEDVLPVRDAILTRIWYVARRDHLQIPFPIAVQYRGHESPSAPEITVEEWLERCPRYRLVREAIREASDRGHASDAVGSGGGTAVSSARVVTFAAGEAMIPLGSTKSGFWLVVEGRASVSAADAAGRIVRISTLGPGDCCGEATVSAGAPSEFLVAAEADVTAIAFDPSRIAEWLQRSSGLAGEVGAAIDARRRAAAALRQRVPVGAAALRPDQQPVGIGG
ncbi:MAG: mechanosensitive ion channel domain-containing protein [Planctomycetia bacterium]